MGLVDLHTHTYYSADGEYSPEEIIDLAVNEGLSAVAITDHDTVEGVSEAIAAGRKQNLEVIPGIEFDTQFYGLNLHILGYYLDWQSERLAEVTTEIRKRQLEQSHKRVKLLQEMDFNLEWAEVEKEANIFPVGGMIAKVLLTNGRNDDDERLEPYRSGERSDQPCFNFYLDYFLPNKPAYVEVELPDSREIIELIHQLGGVAIIAHPGSAIDLAENEEVLTKLTASGLDGLEAYSTYHSSPEVTAFANWAKARNLLLTAGSDFHGKLKPKVDLGGIEQNNYQLVRELKERTNQGEV
ncbi:MAG: PHP domain-containing protein [Bacillota bacterium]